MKKFYFIILALLIIDQYSLHQFQNESINYLFSTICHQNEETLFFFNENLLPLCTRCVGLHLGFFLLITIQILIPGIQLKFVSKKNFFLLVLISSTTYLHWLGGQFDLVEQNTFLRLITGIISGSGVYLLLDTLNIKIDRIQHLANGSKMDFLLVFVLLTTLILINETTLVLFTIVIINLSVIIQILIHWILASFEVNIQSIIRR